MWFFNIRVYRIGSMLNTYTLFLRPTLGGIYCFGAYRPAKILRPFFLYYHFCSSWGIVTALRHSFRCCRVAVGSSIYKLVRVAMTPRLCVTIICHFFFRKSSVQYSIFPLPLCALRPGPSV